MPNRGFRWLGANAVAFNAEVDPGVTWEVMKEAVELVQEFMKGEGWTRAEFIIRVAGEAVGSGKVG